MADTRLIKLADGRKIRVDASLTTKEIDSIVDEALATPSPKATASALPEPAPREIDPSLPSIGDPRDIPQAPDQSSWWDKLKSAGNKAFDMTPPGMMLNAGKAALPYAQPLIDASPVGMMAKQATRASDAVQAGIGEGMKAMTGQETNLKQKLSDIVTQGADYNLDRELGFNPIQLKDIRGIGPAVTSLTGIEEVPALDYMMDPVDWVAGGMVKRGMRIAGKKAAVSEKVANQLAPDPVNPDALQKSIERNIRKADKLAVNSAQRATKAGKAAALDELRYKKQSLSSLIENKKALVAEQEALLKEKDAIYTEMSKGIPPNSIVRMTEPSSIEDAAGLLADSLGTNTAARANAVSLVGKSANKVIKRKPLLRGYPIGKTESEVINTRTAFRNPFTPDKPADIQQPKVNLTKLETTREYPRSGKLPTNIPEHLSGIDSRISEIDLTLNGGDLDDFMKTGKAADTVDPISGAATRNDTYGSLNKVIDDTQTEIAILRERTNKAFDPKAVQLPSRHETVLNPATGKLNATSPLKIVDMDVPATWVDDIYSEIDDQLAAAGKRASDSKGLLDSVRKAIRRKAHYVTQPKKVLAAIGPEAEELAVRNTSYAYGKERIKNETLARVNSMRRRYSDEVMTEAMQSRAYDEPTNKIKVMEAKAELDAFYNNFAKNFEDSKATVKTRNGDINEFTRIHNYVTQSIPKEERAKLAIKLMQANTDSEFVDELIKAGVIKSEQEGLELYNKIRRNPLSEKRTGYQNERAFTPQQLKALGVNQKWGYEVLDEYARASSDVIARNAAFGNKGQLIDAAYQAAVSKAQAMGDNSAVKFLKAQRNEILEGVPKLSDFWNKFLKINTFQIGFGGPAANALQIAMPVATTDMSTVAKAWSKVKKAATTEPDKVARQLGLGMAPDDVNFKAYQQADKDYDSFIYRAADKYAGSFLGIKKLDNFSRQLARATGAERVQIMFDVLKANPKATRFFDDFGFGIDLNKALSRGYLTEREIISAAQNFDNMINFNMISTDLPALFKSPVGRVMFQFQAPAYLQTILFKDVLLKSALSGNFMPLIKYSIAATIAGEAQGTINDLTALRMPTGRDNPNDYGRPNIINEPIERLASNFNKTGFGIVSNWLDAYASGRKLEDVVWGLTGSYPKSLGRAGAALLKKDNSRYGNGERTPDFNRATDAILGLPLGPRIFRTPIQNVLRKNRDD